MAAKPHERTTSAVTAIEHHCTWFNAHAQWIISPQVVP